MVNKFRTLDFLPEVFKTETNAQFLRGTLDVLTSQPDLRRVQGFIGEKYGYSVEPQDKYVVEPTKVRSDYQLDPSVIFLKPGSQQAQDFINYPGIIQALKNQGGITERNDRLFESQFYSWDPFVDLDKLINYSQYYWLPLGPDAVPVTVNEVYLSSEYVVQTDDNGYQFIDVDGINPTLTLIRGGTYTFTVTGGTPLWIQGVPGLSGFAPGSNVNTREVLGVTNNGTNAGTITFTVPAQNAQQQFTQLPGNNIVDLVTSLAFTAIDGQTAASVGTIDGIGSLNGKTLLFYDNGDPTTQVNYWTISVDPSTDIITLLPGAAIVNNEKITVLSGDNFSGRIFYRDITGAIQLVPYISSILDTLYYQSGTEVLSVGKIKIIDSNATNSIDVNEILGQKNYTSPNGVVFTNGLKISFEGNVIPNSYQNNEYYVEGVGTSIKLLPVLDYIAPEATGEALFTPWSLDSWDTTSYDAQLYVPVTPEYITINRNSLDLNAWSRANRWFHQDVLNETIKNLGYVTQSDNNSQTRAKRPIIEFRGSLKLFNSGTEFLDFMTYAAGDNITDAFSQVAGQTSSTTPLVDGFVLRAGNRVIFPYDTDPDVRSKVYEVDYVPDGADLVIALNPVATVLDMQQVVVLTGNEYAGTTWWFDAATSNWTQAQLKQQINQSPLYDIYNRSGVSLSDNDYYFSTNFVGTKLFSYTPGEGQDDPVLGFPIVYTSNTTLGDISFTVNLNADTFEYTTAQGTGVQENINVGFVYEYFTRADYERMTGWVSAIGPSFQYQVFEFPVTDALQSVFVCDVPANSATSWNDVQVYYNDNTLTQDQFQVTVDTANLTTTVTLNTTATAGDKITILIDSEYASKNAYYQVPSNLENNPFNTNITTLSVGDLRNQYRSIFNNIPGATGPVFGDNNYHDLGDVNKYGTAIIQNSASLVLPGVFLRKSEANLFEALQFNSDQYVIYKQLVVDIARDGDYSVYQTTNEILDNVLYEITKVKDNSSAFFWSDMIPSGSPYVTNTYTFGASTTTATFQLSQNYDFDSANYNGVLIYINTQVGSRNISTQLLRGIDYVVSGSSVTVTYNIQAGQSITVDEYNQTYGSYCPNTPSKMGLYPAYVPAVVLDTSYNTPTYFIMGHDGSYTKLYGNYDPVTGLLDDFRDSVLLEFEKRVYNNIKVSGAIPLDFTQVMPGQFRETEYSWSEMLEMYSLNFLNWVGANRLDYKTQNYNVANQFTYNYSQSSDKLSDTAALQGYWRGLYRWFYDCDNPAQFPWQMLGLANEPDWWTSRYGPAPYTNGNTFMWQDIANGYVWNNGAPYVIPDRKRPELLSVLPVNSLGELVSPLYSVIGLYNSQYFQRSWRVGDGAPVETAYLKSSSWPFDMMRLLALTKPAKFFNLFADRDLYKFDAEFDQFLYNGRYHLDPRTLQVYGAGTNKNSYINWIVDFINQRGSNGQAVVSSLLQNLDVRLTYNMAGFTAKEYLKFLVETATPNSRNTNLLIPDESYQVLLYNNVPQERITYSSVIVQKHAEGWRVYGTSQNKQYFTVVEPSPAYFESLTAGSLTVQVSREFNPERTTTIPYGTLFYSVQAVSEFLIDYGRYLTNLGVKFENIIDGAVYDWYRMAQEFLIWAQQDWEVGSVINLNPDAKTFIVDRPGLVVQPLTIQQRNFVLNQNLLPLESQDIAVVRENTAFKITVLTEGETVAYTNLDLSSIEHAIVFDNYTVFNDTIYNLTTGLRQPRLLLQGYKTGDWQGYMDTSGFILNEDNIQEWQPNVKYAKGRIVTYKGFYWTAVTLIEPAAEFSSEVWVKTEYDQIKTGLLPNPSTNAYESLYYYDINRANLEQDADLLAYSLIGFRPRQYLADADLSDTTQVNVYRNIVREKGTNLIANAFRGAELIQGKIDYKLQENWALKQGDFGALLNSNFVEFVLNQDQLKGNPTLIGFTAFDVVPDTQQSVVITNFTNWERPVRSANFLPPYTEGYSDERGIPTAGYVNISDVKLQEFNYTDLNADNTNITNLYRNDAIWIANQNSKWDVYAAVSMNTQVVAVVNALNNTAQVVFGAPHGLSKNDLVAIVSFNASVDGFYTVQQVISDTIVVLDIILDANITTLVGEGAAFRMVSRRFEQPSDAADSILPYSAWSNRKVWIDYDADREWAVYGTSPVFRGTPVLSRPDNSRAGVSVAYSSVLGVLSTDGQGAFYVNSQASSIPGGRGSNSKIVLSNNVIFISSPDDGMIYAYTISATGTPTQFAPAVNIANTGQIAVSNDNLWLYVSNTRLGVVYVFALNTSTNAYNLVHTLNAPVATTGWGNSLATSVDGVKLFVGAPLENSNGVIQSGAVYAYTRKVQRFYGNGLTFSYVVTSAQPITRTYVYINDVLQTSGYSFVADTLTFTTAPADGAIITVSTEVLEFVQRLQSDNVHQGGLFGVSIDTNRYGAELIVGAPFELATVRDVPAVEGAAYRYTNAGQRYGIVNGTVTGVQSGTVFIDGYIVNFSGDAQTIVDQINAQTPTNIVAQLMQPVTDPAGYSFMITIRPGTPETIFNILDVTGTPENLAKLGITLYTHTQTIYSPDLNNNGQFGSVVCMNERDSLVISAPVANNPGLTTFDLTNNCVQDDTVFDHDSTIYIDDFYNLGIVYEFDYLPSSNESILNPGKYAFGQYISSSETTGVATQPKWGSSLAYNSGVIVVGSSQYYNNNAGLVTAFTTTWQPADPCEVVESSSWYVDKKPLPQVNINAINNISIYNNLSNQTLEWLDYIDPIQGKLFGAIETNLDYMSVRDPAGYGEGDIAWTAAYVGKTWLDLNTVRLINYHQPDVTYNASNWGRAFPGSTADIYTWVQSDVPPVDYAGIGFPVVFDRYVEVNTLDGATNSLKTTFYFWVKYFDQVPAGKTLSPVILSQYIINPQSSGIAYLAPISTDIIALYNSQEFIQSNTSSLHLGYQTSTGLDDKHAKWQLIRENNPEDFLTGFRIGKEPTGQYLKFIESFTGVDATGQIVPDPRLPELLKYGTSFRPRQSMFIDRVGALQNYLTYANEIIINYPIAETKNLNFLKVSGPGFDTSEYWQYVDWWAPGFGADTKPVLELPLVNDLQTIVNNQLIVGSEGLSLALEDGLVVKIAANASSQSEYYVYNTDTGWTRIGLTNGTIQFLPKLWQGPFGWNSNAFDSIGWDNYPSQEIYWIIRWVNEYCYVNELDDQRNTSLILMFKYIQSTSLEQDNYLPWLNKTSLIDVNHRVRELLPYKKFQRDNQEFLAGYLNEVKPYHVYIKDFVFSYDGQDTYDSNITDFDLPAKYNAELGKFETPRLVYQPTFEPDEYTVDSEIWADPLYSQWFNNFGLSISNAEIGLTQVSTLAQYVGSANDPIVLKNSRGLPYTGIIKIGPEIISYESIDYITNTLQGVNRGVDGTPVVSLLPGTPVLAELPSVVVLDQGRAYTEPPSIQAYIDLGIYPAPREVAQFRPVMANDRLIAVEVLNPGSGYAVIPDIIIEPSIVNTFDWQAVDIYTNTIYVPNHGLQSGDSVVYYSGDSASSPVGLKNNTYYYVKVFDTNNFALYTTYQQSVQTAETAAGDGRVPFITTGTGTDYSVRLTPRVVCFTSGLPVREFNIKLKYDRVTYTSNVQEWQSGGLYAGVYVNNSSSSADLLASSPAPASKGGIVLTITSVTSDIDSNTIINATYTGVAAGQITGQQFQLYTASGSSWSNQQNFYLRALTTARFQVYYDPLFNYPVPVAEFDATLNRAYLPEPFYFERSLVTYGGKLWRCEISNNDTVFDPLKWSLVSSDDPDLTAADRVMGFYKPTANMTGRDLRQLLAGIEYPDAIFSGARFNLEREPYSSLPYDDEAWDTDIDIDRFLDTRLRSPSFTDVLVPANNPTYYDVQGGVFAQGYGPEELVPGLVTDGMNFNVTTKPGSNWDPFTIQHYGFRVHQFVQTVDSNNQISFANILANPATLVMFAQTSIPPGDSDCNQFRVPDDSLNYTVDWYNSVITVNEPYLQTVPLTVVLYEFGNGSQLARANNTVTPLRDAGTHSEIYLEIPFDLVTVPSLDNYYGSACVYVNGRRIPYRNEITGAPEWFVIEGRPNDPRARIVFNTLYDNDLDYVTYVINTGASGTSIPQTQNITITDPTQLVYTLDNFMGDNNAQNAIVELNGFRLYNLIPNEFLTYAVADTWAYTIPIAIGDIPSFDPANVKVFVAGVEVFSPDWVTNFDSLTLSGAGLDGEWNALYGYLDVGVTLNSQNLYVVFSPAYASTIVPGVEIRVQYASGLTTPYIINVDSNGRGILTLSSGLPLVTNDIVSVTSFNRTDNQSLVTQVFNGVTVTEITNIEVINGWDEVNYDDGNAWDTGVTLLTTANPHNLVTGTQVTIDSVDGSIRTEAFVQVINPTQVYLYTDKNLTNSYPYNGLYTGSGGYIWRSDTFVLAQEDYTLTDTTRLWVTVDDSTDSVTGGAHTNSNCLRLYNNMNITGDVDSWDEYEWSELGYDSDNYTARNVLGLLREINEDQQVVVLSMVPNASPDELDFRINVNKYGDQTIWRTNQFTKTFLTDTLYSTGRIDDVLRVHDVRRLVDVQEFENQVLDSNNVVTVTGFPSDQMTYIRIVDDMTTTEITDFVLDPELVNGIEYIRNNNNGVNILINQPVLGTVTVTVAVGNSMIIQSEQLTFTKVNLDTNEISGLGHGKNGTISNSVYHKYAQVQSMKNRDLMFQEYYDDWWYQDNMPLQLNNSPAAQFLQQQVSN